MDKKNKNLFDLIRKKVAAYIKKEVDKGTCHKSYEGTWEVLASFPDYFEDETATAPPNFYRITLHCYLLGPDRHYNWDGNTLEEALRKCECSIDNWIKDAAE